jgi:hypothetical protein
LVDRTFGKKAVFLVLSSFLLAGFFFVAAIWNSLWWRFSSFQCIKRKRKSPSSLGWGFGDADYRADESSHSRRYDLAGFQHAPLPYPGTDV